MAAIKPADFEAELDCKMLNFDPGIDAAESSTALSNSSRIQPQMQCCSGMTKLHRRAVVKLSMASSYQGRARMAAGQ